MIWNCVFITLFSKGQLVAWFSLHCLVRLYGTLIATNGIVWDTVKARFLDI